MPVTFVIGRAGTGKTYRCFERIVAAMREDPLGPPIYWIVPRQATFNAERELTCRSGLSGFCRTRVVSFDQFRRDVLADRGGSSIPEVTAIGRQLVLGHLLRTLEPHLEFFRASARRVGLAAQLDLAFAELERSGAGAERLESLISELDSCPNGDVDTAALLAKLRDFRLLYGAYDKFLGQERLDQHRRAEQVLELLEQCAFLASASFYVDGFSEFTENERRLLVGIGRRALRLEICLLMDPSSRTLGDPDRLPDELSLFHKTERAYRWLYFGLKEAGVKIEQPVRLSQTFRFGNEALKQLEQTLFDSAAKPSKDASGLVFIEAADARAEIDAVAREIQELIVGGARRREIAVIARELERYERHITASFIEHGIPCFIDRRRTASHHPLVQTLLALLQIARFDWPTDAMLALLKAGLAPVSEREADAIENHLLAVVARGAGLWQSSDAWEPAVGLPPEEGLLPAMAIQVDEARRRVAAAVGPLVEALNGSTELRIREIATALFETLDRLKIRPTLERWMAEARSNLQIEQANEHEQVWAELVALFDQMVDLLGDTTMTLAEFIDVLDAGLETFDLALTPPTLDQVLIGQVDRSRSPELKAVFVVGLSEGEFPAAASEKLLLSDRERRELQSRNVEIEPDSRRLLLDERLLGYIALTRASQRLYLCRSTQDRAAHPCEPSLFWRRARELFGGAAVRAAVRPESRPPALIATPRQLVTSLMQWARDPDGAAEDSRETFASLYQWLATRPLREDAIDVVRYRAWKALSYRNDAELLPDIRQRLFEAPLQVNARQLETFAACPYQHFLKFGLRLTQRQKPELSGYHISQLYRQLLHRLLDRTLRDQKLWEEIDEESVDRSMAEIDAELSGAIGRAGGRGAHLLQRARRTLLEFREAQARTFQRSRFRPALSLTSFGRGGTCPSLRVKTSAGDSVAVYGKIDRVDLREQGGAACVIDYRLSAGALSVAEIYHGLALRLLTSLLALQGNGQRVAGREIVAAGAFHMPVLRKIVPVGHPSEKKEEVHYARPRGIFSERHLADLDTELTTGRSDVVAAQIRVDGQLGSRDRNDVADQAEFEALLKHVERQLGEIAQKILSGDISIAPYRLNDRSPCTRCEYKECCRFHVSTNRYRWLQGGDRSSFFGNSAGGEDAG